MSAHTPGPWSVEHPYGEPGVFVSGPATELIARVYNDSEANARLIAASPDLLESLRQTVDSLKHWFPRWGDPQGANSAMMQHARAAIAKAEGRL